MLCHQRHGQVGLEVTTVHQSLWPLRSGCLPIRTPLNKHNVGAWEAPPRQLMLLLLFTPPPRLVPFVTQSRRK